MSDDFLPERATQHHSGREKFCVLRYLLDTKLVIYVLKRRPVEVLSTFNSNASPMAISSKTLAELIHGAEKSSRQRGTMAPSGRFGKSSASP